MKTIRVLLVDDHPLTLEGMRQVLDREPDLEVVGEAAQGEEAIRLAQRLRPDILLLDISMPIMNGIEVADSLRRTAPETRIVVMTGYEENDHYNEALLRLGIKGYLPKRTPGDELVGHLRAVHAGKTCFRGAYDGQSSQQTASNDVTGRELQILRLVAEGHANREIADRLYTSESTVRFHIHNLFTKLGVKRRTELVSVARQRGLV